MRGRPKNVEQSDVWGSIAWASAAPLRATYINLLTAGMKAKKYKGGKATRIKAQTSRLFEAYFKPLPQ